MNSRKQGIVWLAVFCAWASVTYGQNRIGTGTVKKLYQNNCASCHGSKLQGGEGSSLIDDVWRHGASDEEIAATIRNGVPELGMLPWKGVLSDEEIRSLVIFIREQKQLSGRQELLDRVQPKGGVFKTERHDFKLVKVAKHKGTLWSLDFLPDGSILTTERNGDLWVVKEGKFIGPIKGTPKVWQHGQGGLLEVALHPKYEENGWVYLSFSESTKGESGGMTAVVRGRIKKGRWVDQEEIFHVPAKFYTKTGAHFGSRFVFKDDTLFFSIGDRGRKEMAQDLTRPNGKIHRVYDDGRIPEDNPFVGVVGAYPSIWSFGNRNAQGLDLHPLTGELWESEHGPRGGDEINKIQRGVNYGWPVITYGMNYNGTPITDITEKEGMARPVHYWTPSIAVCGIDFYEGDRFPGWKYDLFATGLASEE
ncbi:MAG: PQQ-dependent sugar dehydrogenase [Opitutaceae bacterium]|nr:PQQ-dependent sugar dehydrogenase [Opitutaceae bacterium]